MEQNNFENRLDKSIMRSYFINTFKEDLMGFVNKFNLDKKTLGPWFTPKFLESFLDEDAEDEFFR